jgi:predicted nucleic acid-binding protein
VKYLLDTNVISETIRERPNPAVRQWLQQIAPDSLFISVLSLGEIRRGIEKLGAGKRRNQLLLWLENDILEWFGDNILSVDIDVAERWGYITATLSKSSTTAIDTLLAATALTHNLKLVTRNVKDFVIPGLEVFNPFE